MARIWHVIVGKVLLPSTRDSCLEVWASLDFMHQSMHTDMSARYVEEGFGYANSPVARRGEM
jgi:hypothetical protein